MRLERKAMTPHYVTVALLACALGGVLAPACAESDSVQAPGTTPPGTGSSTGTAGGDGGAPATTTSSGAGGADGGFGGAGGTAGAGGAGGTAGGGGAGGTAGAGGAGGTAGGGGAGGAAGAGGIGGEGVGGAACVPALETCNGLDDDCNLLVDEGDPGGGGDCVATGLGECRRGRAHCIDGVIRCVPGLLSPEVCDGLDNNCDGNVDEGNPGGGIQCMTGLLGLCGTGITTCAGISGVVCQPVIVPGSLVEACNGLDDDCDGVVDEGIVQVGQPCTATGYVGTCQFGTFSCSSVAPFQLTCNHPLPGTIAETCNALDDDCNGTIDDPALLNGLPCSSGVPGICAAGRTQCTGGSSTCVPTVAPGSVAELCNTLDDNCNGSVDEMNPTVACTSQLPSAQFVQSWACTTGACQIVACTSGYANIDGAPANGCECVTDAYSNNCSVAGSVSVSGGATVTMTGKIESAAGSDWLTFNFTVPALGAAYHPRISITDSGGGQYAMDVMTSCTDPAGCSTTGGANNENGIRATTWEQNYNGYIPGTGCCSDSTPRVASVRVRVYRRLGDSPTCSGYTVTATNL